MASKTRKAELTVCVLQVRIPEMLHCAHAIVHYNQCITTQQLPLILSITKVTSFHILDIQKYAQDGFLRASQSKTEPRGKSFLPSCGHISKLGERTSCPGLLQVMKPGPAFWTRDKKAICGMAPFSFPCLVGKVINTVFWDCEGVTVVDVMLRRETIKSDA